MQTELACLKEKCLSTKLYRECGHLSDFLVNQDVRHSGRNCEYGIVRDGTSFFIPVSNYTREECRQKSYFIWA